MSLGVELDVGGIIFHQLHSGGRVLCNCAELGKAYHCKPHIDLLVSGYCSPGPGNCCIGVPCLAIPRCKPVLPTGETEPRFHCSFVLFLWIQGPTSCQTLPSIASASAGLTASPPVEAMVLLLWPPQSPLPSRVAAQLQALPMLKLLHKASHSEKQRICVGSERETHACRSRLAHGCDSCLQ